MTIQKLVHGFHILAITDISSDIEEMDKSSFDPVNEGGHDTVALWLGWKLVSNKVYIYYQHMKVTKNIISDSLSRDFHILDHYLTKKPAPFSHQIKRNHSTSNHAHKYFFIDTVTSRNLDMTNGISKATVTKHSGNWKRWCKLLTHTGIKKKFIEKTLLLSSFTASVQTNKFGTTKKYKILHRTIKDAISYVYVSFWAHLWD